ncbi:MAG: HAD family hydrolase [Caulobacteraceae bacterium]|nr:HAD family hydrolase [Caulobacteraceae bacterium]
MSELILGFDADDTLWHNETVFNLTQARFIELLGGFAEPEHLAERLLAVELRNLRHYGYGVKSFTLSMIETALELTGEAIPSRVVAEILAIGRAMLEHPVEPLPAVHETLERLSQTHALVLITKGDLLDQENKLARSGLGDFFDAVEIVSEKTAATYSRVFARHGALSGEAAMIGNSARSDIIPAIDAGFWGVHIPYALTWEHEQAEAPADSPFYVALASIAEVPAWLGGLQPA